MSFQLCMFIRMQICICVSYVHDEYVCVFIYTGVCIYALMCMRLCLSIRAMGCMHIYLHACICVCSYGSLCVYIHMCACARIYESLCVCAHLCYRCLCAFSMLVCLGDLSMHVCGSVLMPTYVYMRGACCAYV